MVRIDMSEYQERHTVSRLVGAPPGYVGYEESGQLTEAVRRKPYSVILLDEIEKAHQDIFNILLQVLDDGRLTDNKGRTVNFKNTIIIMTSNLGSHLIQERFEKMTDDNKDELWQKTREEVFNLLKATITPEFLNRIDDIIMFKPLTREEIGEVVKLQFKQLKDLLSKNGINITLTEKAADWIAGQGFDPQFGARPVKRIIQRNILNELSKMILSGSVKQDKPVVIDLQQGKLLFLNE
jgi:ATP-dependent Clp protease ATP-binding subunit ClpB